MKTKTIIFSALITLAVVSCKKESSVTPVSSATSGGTNTYSSLQDFYNANGVQLQSYTLDASFGGTFITPKGTKVTIPANAFITQTGGPVSGIVTIEFKDIYSKSDMLLSNVPSMTTTGAPLKSAGEFFIKAVQGADVLQLDAGQAITVEQPIIAGETVDTAMAPFAGSPDTVGMNPPITWWPIYSNTVTATTVSYIFSLYSFNMPVSNGSWCNSDNSGFFYGLPQTTLNLHCTDDVDAYQPDIFLIFNGVNSMVHVYRNTLTDFNYNFAPVGYQCTVVAIGAKDGVLYSSFTPITITSGLTVNFSLTATTDAAFTAQLNALN